MNVTSRGQTRTSLSVRSRKSRAALCKAHAVLGQQPSRPVSTHFPSRLYPASANRLACPFTPCPSRSCILQRLYYIIRHGPPTTPLVRTTATTLHHKVLGHQGRVSALYLVIPLAKLFGTRDALFCLAGPPRLSVIFSAALREIDYGPRLAFSQVSDGLIKAFSPLKTTCWRAAAPRKTRRRPLPQLILLDELPLGYSAQ